MNKKGITPIGEQENGKIFGLSTAERPGILFLFGRTHQGKSVTLAEIILSDIHNQRGGLFIDPWGDLIEDILAHTPTAKAKKVKKFEATTGTFDENVKRFDKEIGFDQLQKDDQLFVLCKIAYKTLGEGVAREFGTYLTKQFLKVIKEGNRTLGLDEAHNFLDDEAFKQITQNKAKGLSVLLADQSSGHYQKDIFEGLLKASSHVLSFALDEDTAKLINKYHPEMKVSELMSLEKFHFMAKVNAKGTSPAVTKLRGIFPIPYPIN